MYDYISSVCATIAAIPRMYLYMYMYIDIKQVLHMYCTSKIKSRVCITQPISHLLELYF